MQVVPTQTNRSALSGEKRRAKGEKRRAKGEKRRAKSEGRFVSPRQKRVRLPLIADGGERAVSGHDDGLVRQGEYGAVQRLHDLFVRATRQVGAANGAREQRISRDQLLLGSEIQADAQIGRAHV